MDEMAVANLDARIQHAMFRTKRVREFQARFPPIAPEPHELLPPIGWRQIERQLRHLAGPDFERASWETEVLKVSARMNPPELFYRELLTLGWSLIDGVRAPTATEGGMD